MNKSGINGNGPSASNGLLGGPSDMIITGELIQPQHQLREI